MEGAYLI